MRINPFAQADGDSAPHEDYGFGEKLSGRGVRLLDKNGDFNVVRKGVHTRHAYQWLIKMRWWAFFAAVIAYYVLINFILGVLFYAIGVEGISGIPTGPWYEELAGCFFFSIQTFTTVGYGSMSPSTVPQQLLAGIGALIGLMSLALATGLFFARFSRPQKLVMFSNHALIAPYQEGTGFMFRIASRSSTKLINVGAQVVYSWVSEEGEGSRKRQFFTLPLERETIAMFPLNWTIVHPITADSPLVDCDVAAVDLADGEFIVQISGYDETYARQVYAHTSYRASCLKFGQRFAPMYHPTAEGQMVLRLDRIDALESAPIAGESLTDALDLVDGG